uniref:Uncharacterized protein n=1 Tax=Arundo donax TaxID=35708 RepID=A0A0A8ZNR6_ARUDO
MEDIDIKADHMELFADEWAERYNLANQLEHIYHMKEIYWKQRSGVTLVLKGDSNSKFFHQAANVRRRRSTIMSLDTDGGTVTSQAEITEHIVAFYK